MSNRHHKHRASGSTLRRVAKIADQIERDTRKANATKQTCTLNIQPKGWA